MVPPFFLNVQTFFSFLHYFSFCNFYVWMQIMFCIILIVAGPLVDNPRLLLTLIVEFLFISPWHHLERKLVISIMNHIYLFCIVRFFIAKFLKETIYHFMANFSTPTAYTSNGFIKFFLSVIFITIFISIIIIHHYELRWHTSSTLFKFNCNCWIPYVFSRKLRYQTLVWRILKILIYASYCNFLDVHCPNSSVHKLPSSLNSLTAPNVPNFSSIYV